MVTPQGIGSYAGKCSSVRSSSSSSDRQSKLSLLVWDTTSTTSSRVLPRLEETRVVEMWSRELVTNQEPFDVGTLQVAMGYTVLKET